MHIARSYSFENAFLQLYIIINISDFHKLHKNKTTQNVV